MSSKKIKIFVILATIIIIAGLGVFYYENNGKVIKQEENQEILIKNSSWQSPFGESIPFKKGNELEINIILKDNENNKIKLNLNKLKNKINIKKISIDNKDLDNINDDIIGKNGSKVKIIGEARDDGIIKKDDKDITFDKTKDTTKEEEKNTKTQTGNINKEVTLQAQKLNSNISNLIEVFGEGKDNVKYVNIGGISLKPIKYNDQVFLSINKNTFVAGEYFIIVQFTNSELKTLEEKITFNFSNQNVNIANITPNEIKNDLDRYIVLQGNGFKKIISIQLNNNIILKNTSFDIINDNVLSVKIPKELDSGKYYFNIMTVDGIYELKNNTFIVNN